MIEEDGFTRDHLTIKEDHVPFTPLKIPVSML